MKQRVESRGHRMSRQMVANLRDTEEGCAKEAHRKPSVLVTKMGCAMEAHRKPSVLVTEMGCAMEAHRKPSVRFVRLLKKNEQRGARSGGAEEGERNTCR